MLVKRISQWHTSLLQTLSRSILHLLIPYLQKHPKYFHLLALVSVDVRLTMRMLMSSTHQRYPQIDTVSRNWVSSIIFFNLYACPCCVTIYTCHLFDCVICLTGMFFHLLCVQYWRGTVYMAIASRENWHLCYSSFRSFSTSSPTAHERRMYCRGCGACARLDTGRGSGSDFEIIGWFIGVYISKSELMNVIQFIGLRDRLSCHF